MITSATIRRQYRNNFGVTDNYDSYNTENDLFVFESIFAEMYAADISKKITYAKHTLGMNGVKLKSRPLYGYKLVDGDHNRWEIDEESAKIVRMIFDMFLHQDMSINSIAKYLRTNKVSNTEYVHGIQIYQGRYFL